MNSTYFRRSESFVKPTISTGLVRLF